LERNMKSDKLGPIPLLKQAFDMAVREDGWAFLAAVGIHLSQLDPGFDPRTYGFKQLLQLIKAYPNIFEFKEYHPKLGSPTYSIRIKE